MKRLSLFILFILLTVSPSLCLDTPKNLREVDLSVNGVKLGTSYSIVLRQIGRPLQVKVEKIFDETCSPPYSWMTLRYSGLIIELEGNIKGRDFRVVSVDVSSSKWLAAPGIRIGMTEQEVRSQLGQPSEEANESGLHRLDYVTKGNDGGASLYFRSRKLVKIRWEAALC